MQQFASGPRVGIVIRKRVGRAVCIRRWLSGAATGSSGSGAVGRVLTSARERLIVTLRRSFQRDPARDLLPGGIGKPDELNARGFPAVTYPGDAAAHFNAAAIRIAF